MRMQRRTGWKFIGCPNTQFALLSLTAAGLMPNSVHGGEVIVKNDTVVVNSTPFAQLFNFNAGDQVGARLIMPCDGTIVGVQVGWWGTFAQTLQYDEAAVHIFSDGVFPDPGAELATVIDPVLFSDPSLLPTVNEFRWLDPPTNSMPINVTVSSGDAIIVTLELANPTNTVIGGANFVSDIDGCTANANILFSSSSGMWFDACTFIGGDLVFRVIIDCDEEGACCFDDGTCALLMVNDCEAQSGTFAGEGVDCITANCPQPIGACCIPSTGECVDLLQSECTAVAGVWVGLDTSCATTVCFLPGACCMPDGSCTDTGNQGQCNTAGGSFQGNGTTCAAVSCLQPCPADIIVNGEVDVLDLLSLLANWGPCAAPCPDDFIVNGEVDVLDLLALLADWGSCP